MQGRAVRFAAALGVGVLYFVAGKLGLAFASPNAFTSGTNYLGSDRDFIQVGASLVLIGGNAVLPETNAAANAQTSAFPTGPSASARAHLQ